MPDSSHLPDGSVNATRGDRLAAGDARQVAPSWRASSPLVQQRVGGEHDGREERGAQQRPAHLLEHDAELDVAVARAAELLGDDAGPAGPSARPSATTRPGRSPFSVSICSRTAVSGALGVEEAADGLAQLFLLLGEGEVHGANACAGWRASRPIRLVYTCVHTCPRPRSASASCAPTWRRPSGGPPPDRRTVVTLAGRPAARLGPLDAAAARPPSSHREPTAPGGRRPGAATSSRCGPGRARDRPARRPMTCVPRPARRGVAHSLAGARRLASSAGPSDDGRPRHERAARPSPSTARRAPWSSPPSTTTPVWSRVGARRSPRRCRLIDRLTDEAVLRADLEDAVRRTWDHLHVVPGRPALPRPGRGARPRAAAAPHRRDPPRRRRPAAAHRVASSPSTRPRSPSPSASASTSCPLTPVAVGPRPSTRWHDCGHGRDTLHWVDADVEIHKVVVGPYDNNVFVVRCRRHRRRGADRRRQRARAAARAVPRLGVRRVLETHGHWDHIQAVPAIREAGYEVAVTALDAPKLNDVGYDVFLDDAEVIEVGQLRLDAIHNPGHTPGSISFQRRGHAAAVHRRHPVPGRAGQHELRGRRLRHDHPLDRGPAVHVPRRHGRAARPRRRHDDRRRAPAPRRVDRPRLVTPARDGTTSGRLDHTPVHTADLPPTPVARPQHPGRRRGSRPRPTCSRSATTSPRSR